MPGDIFLKDAEENNLKKISLKIPSGRFVVITGVSGSGKSSLAFDTLYAEGQRRYVESLSAFARRRLGPVHKPLLGAAENLTPTISIEQKTVSKNPRSTVGTITEIYDYLRVLFARAATPCCPVSGKALACQSKEAIFRHILEQWEGRNIILLAPLAKNKKGEFQDLFEHLLKRGFLRARVDGQLREVDPAPKLDKSKTHTIELAVDRLTVSLAENKRLMESIEVALKEGGGVFSLLSDDEEQLFSTEGYSEATGLSYSPLEPSDFSFNAPQGMCEACKGLGKRRDFDLDKIIDPEKSIAEDCFSVGSSYSTVRHKNIYDNLAKLYKFSVQTPWKKLSADAKEIILHGNNQKWTAMRFVHPESRKRWTEYVAWRGVLHEAMQRYVDSTSDFYKQHIEVYMHLGVCNLCHGGRLKAYPLAALYEGKRIHEVVTLPLSDALSFFAKIRPQPIAEEPVREILLRLRYLVDVGLDYLSLERESPSLSGGEAQRVRLAALIGSGLVGVTYILDEPTIGLHPRDNGKLIATLRRLQALGNTVVVVEHDEEMILNADHLIDIGPGAGKEGGHLLYQGSPAKLKNTLTADYISGKKKILGSAHRKAQGFLSIADCTHNNLKKVTVTVPIGCFVAVTGVSGSGKSSLVVETLFPALSNLLMKSTLDCGAHGAITGLEHLDKIILIDQSPIGRIPRSNPATYIKLFDDIRDLFCQMPESKARGWSPGRFSFNVKEGSCPTCEGMGQTRVDMDFLEEQWVTCETCHGKRFDEETLSVRYKDHSIADVLNMSIDEASVFFDAQPIIRKKLELLQRVGLGYMRIGQPSTTLSGGEAQRIKLAKELVRPASGRTLYILDEPTTGLHFHDTDQLLHVLHVLVDRGNTVLVIEHNMDVVRSADWNIELGPDGGARGGKILYSGIPKVPATHAQPAVLPRDLPETTHITIKGARQHNLKNISLTLPRGAITVITGPSGSGKSSLAFDTLYAEGQRRYSETLSPYARQFVTPCPKPKVDAIEGLSPAVAIEQKASSGNPRSTVGTMTEIYDYLRILWAWEGTAHCPDTKKPIRAITKDRVADQLTQHQAVTLLGPTTATLEQLSHQGFVRIWLNGTIYRIDDNPPYDPKRKNQLMVVVDRITDPAHNRHRLLEAIDNAAKLGKNTLYALHGEELTFFNLSFTSPSGKSYPPITPHTFSFNSKEGMCTFCLGIGCAKCDGDRLNPLARHVLLEKLSLPDFCRLSLDEALAFIEKLPSNPILNEVLQQIKARLSFMIDVGIGYLSLDRTAPTLSNGESQRIRLAAQLGSCLTNILYVLDEPTVGLHPEDTKLLKKALLRLKKLGNTLVLVEHDPLMIAMADHVVELGPKAGLLGGQIMDEKDSLTQAYLSGKRQITCPPKRLLPKQEWLTIEKASAHNLKSVSTQFPKGAISAIVGVSGSGKSTLLHQVLGTDAVLAAIYKKRDSAPHISGLLGFKELAIVTQEPLGQTNRADVASYSDLLTPLRSWYASLPEAVALGLTPGAFSANSPSGMCSACSGHGFKRISMLFMPSVDVPCSECHGMRLKKNALTVTYKGKNLGQVLQMTVDEALLFFADIPKVVRVLQRLHDVGLSYLQLGQEIQTLSGGEAQRIKLAAAIGSRGKTLFLLDEPTAGLHLDDIASLLPLFRRLADSGHTVILIEHNTEVIKRCDWIVELGPQAGAQGGHLIAQGSVDQIKKNPRSVTGKYL